MVTFSISAAQWWSLAPSAVTILCVVAATLLTDNSTDGGYGHIGRGLGNLILWLAAGLCSVLAWLLYLIVILIVRW